jgi:lysophospholipase L1-like esterase
MNNIRFYLRLALCLVISVFTLEACARLDDYFSYRAPILGVYNSDGMYETDRIGKRGKPFGRYKKWQLNSLGFRGPELRPGSVRILCFGASETFGLYEPPGEEYPRVLEQDLNAHAGHETYDVLNVAYAGESVHTAALRVPEIVERVRPQVAVIYPSLANYIWLPWSGHNAAAPAAPTAQAASPRFQFEWRIGENVHNLLKEVLPQGFQSWLREREIRRDATRFGPTMDRVPEHNVEVFRQDLLELVHVLKASGVEPVLVTHATRFGQTSVDALSTTDRRMLVSWRKFFPMLSEKGFLDMEARLNDVVRSVASEEHVQLVDAAREIPPGDTNFADYAHFTAAGSAVMAGKLTDGLTPVLAGLPKQAPIVPASAGETQRVPGNHTPKKSIGAARVALTAAPSR